MQCGIVSDQTRSCAFVRVTGVCSAKDLGDLMQAILSLDLARRGAPVIVDLRNASIDASSEELREIGYRPIGMPTERALRHILIAASSDATFGQMRIMTALRDRPGHKPVIFRTLSEAAAFIQMDLPDERFPEEIERLLATQIVDATGRSVNPISHSAYGT